jgi:DNA mismatch repair protein MutL
MITEHADLKIELLPEHIIDQIKAGEVLERPASLIKELIENSIDAKASKIDIQIVENGLDLIAIEDDGIGMSIDNLPYAFLRHATSKIKKFDDLYHLRSYGFRGEALASVAATSRVTCQTQPQDLAKFGGKIIINGGIEELLVPMKNPKHGTSLFIKNLFYNTPARLKFIKSKTSERIQMRKMLYAFLLSHPEIAFSIKWDDKEKETYSKEEDKNYYKRFSDIVYPKKKEAAPILIAQNEYDGHKVTVVFTLIPSKNSPNKHQYLFANNRLFFDKNLHQTIIRNTDSIWKYGESGHYAIFIETPPEEIDVNVHPNKTQIKFSKSDVVYSLLVSSIKDAISKYYKNSRPENGQSSVPIFTEQTFIDQNTERYHSLIGLSTKEFDSKPIPSIDSNNYTNHPLSEETFIALNHHFFIFKDNEEFYLAEKYSVLLHYLKNLINQALESEENISPLLISEPLQFSESLDIALPELKRCGYELDRLNKDILVLRTIPRNIHRNLIRISALLIGNFFIKYKLNKFDPIKFLNSSNYFNEEIIKEIDLVPLNVVYSLLEKNKHELIHISKKLTAERLVKFFNEK